MVSNKFTRQFRAFSPFAVTSPQAHNCRVNVRKLAAIDLLFLGLKLILDEFGIGVVGSLALGAFSAWQGTHRFHSEWMVLFGVYLICIGINYVPLFVHAIDISRQGSAKQEIADELQNSELAFRKYRRQPCGSWFH